ncbi:sensor domain-containing protein [Trichloromonas sp.]|uniref:sensor domain-containing protein n=1 Tax=Trichloromonas sp. TaxID=3069249 RepID=UPI003D813947
MNKRKCGGILNEAYLRLQESEKRYRDLYHKTPVMLHSIDPNGCLLTVSDLWLKTLGYHRVEVIGRRLTEFMSRRSRQLVEDIHLPEFFKTGDVPNVAYQMVAKDGRPIDVLLSAVAERDSQGAIISSLAVLIDVTERKRAEDKVHRLAYYDTLTGLPNRTLFQDRLSRELMRAQRENSTLEVMFLDLDQFKGINDTLGHGAGDALLQSVAGRLQKCLRDVDTVARFGGDEFVILLAGLDDEQDPSIFARRILDAIASPVTIDEKELFTTASIGIAVYPTDGTDAETMLRKADIAMYEAKELGRNTYQFFSAELNSKTLERLQLETSLRQALARNELFLSYQPQLDLNSGEIIGIEALLRWCHPEKGLVPPEYFIPVAEETGMIIPIGEFVLRTACAQAKSWQTLGLPPTRIAVNVSARQFKQHDFVDRVETILNETGLQPDLLELELTESTVMENVQSTIMTLTDLKIRGVRLAIDDFGTGHSSLVYLKHFPIDRIKIAQEFVRDIPKDPDNEAIIGAIIAMAESLNLKVIAEGVESKEQLSFLHNRRCNEMQGFYFARPLTPDHLADLLTRKASQPAACLFSGNSIN